VRREEEHSTAVPAAAWPALPLSPLLGEDEVHLVRIGLAPSDWREELCLLSGDERSRASRFAFEVHRRRFIAARAALRRILAAYLRGDPSHLTFSYSAQGRPSVAGSGGLALDFNLAHSEELALLALAPGPVGVDLEHLGGPADAMQIARHFFSAREVGCLERLPPASRARGFFCAWTRKEAVLKAAGRGLAALREVEVSLEAEPSPAVLSGPGGASGWGLLHLEPAPDFVGALAVSGPRRRLRCWEWRWR
jgi:4'-phosphopantetheinyl transferase